MMFPIKHSAQQTEPIDLRKQQLPAMYDLLGRRFRGSWEGRSFSPLATATVNLRLRADAIPEQIFSGGGINLDRDVRHRNCYK